MGGLGTDDWGGWIRRQLHAEGVNLDLLSDLGDYRTPVALVTVSREGEPRYFLYGDPHVSGLASASGSIPEAIEAHDVLVATSNSMVRPAERELTLSARLLALENERPFVFDANLRTHRWESPACAAAAVRECAPGAFLVKLNQEEAELVTGLSDPESAAREISAMGASLALVSMGADGVVLAGEGLMRTTADPVGVVSTVGAGDALLGSLLGSMVHVGFDEEGAREALPKALRAASEACRRWGATT